MHLAIVAGGLGSRLAPVTNFVPKFLVNIGKQTGLVEQIRYWRQYDLESITLIVHPDYAQLTLAYYTMYFKDDKTKVHIKTVDVANGSAHAIMTTCEHLKNQSVIFTWCDVLPGETFDPSGLNCAAMSFMNYDHPNRYDLAETGGHLFPAIRDDGRGGIFGIYYVNQFELLPFADGQDFVEILHQYSAYGVVPVPISKIVDWGDKPKLDRTRDSADRAREFNLVTMHGGLVKKEALNEQGKVLIAREAAWYTALQEISGDGIHPSVNRPNVWTHTSEPSFIMTKVEGVAVWEQWPKLDDEGRRFVLNRIFKQLDGLHAKKFLRGAEKVMEDVKAEAYDKLLARYSEIKDVVASFGDVQYVNGWRLRETNAEITITRLYARLVEMYAGTTEYSLIHGDLQMSNTMINPDTLEITLIDPRGYFGKTQTLGLADYDIAKLYYSLSGYDLFNYSKDFNISHLDNKTDSGGKRINFVIPKPELGGTIDLFAERFWYVHQLWLAVIWIGLAGYIKNDPVKSVCAHYHGLVMAEKVLAECFDMTQP